jgi:hypothetical protein
MNSRAYLFILPLHAPGDIPDDFGASLQGRPFERGIFLPQADTEWFTQTPKYPARLLLLNGGCLHIVPHPTSGQDVVELNLADIVQLETGSSLLSGWIHFSTRVSTLKLLYNTRASNRLEEFIAIVRRRWLGAPTAGKKPEAKRFGPELDIKFRNLFAEALDRDDSVLCQCFAPPLADQSKFALFRKNKWRPGHLIVLTSGNRLLWLKDDYRGHWERYAGITVSAPRSLFRSSTVETAPDHYTLVIDFAADYSWRIEIYQWESGCGAFSETLNGIVPKGSNDSKTATIQ